MITIPDLQTALLDLLHEIENTDIKLIIGGGFGIYLKTDHVRQLGVRTLFREWLNHAPPTTSICSYGRSCSFNQRN